MLKGNIKVGDIVFFMKNLSIPYFAALYLSLKKIVLK